MMRVKADLHIHTTLSSCASREMTPSAIVNEARRRGLGMIGICDHNTADNSGKVRRSAGPWIEVVAGMEITTSEEVHVLALFPDGEAAVSAGRMVKRTLPKIAGRSVLEGATRYTVRETLELIAGHGGLAVAAHVDRSGFGIIGQLGFFPEDAPFDAVEVSPNSLHRWRDYRFRGIPVIAGSDSHYLSDMGRAYTILEVEVSSFEELRKALGSTEGRRFCIA